MFIRRIAKKSIEMVAPSVAYSIFLKTMTAKENEILILPFMVRRHSVALDIGANRGLYVHHLLAVTPNVIAFEPLSPMRAVLRRNYGHRIRLEPVALSSASGTAALRFPEGNYSWATLEESNEFLLPGKKNRVVVESVETRTLDSYQFENIGLIKIDVEGHEESVLLGARQTIKRNEPALIVEIEERHRPGSVGRVVKMLQEMQYVAFYIVDNRLCKFEEFDIERDQSVCNVGLSGKTGRYINNFIFIPRLNATNFQNSVRKLFVG